MSKMLKVILGYVVLVAFLSMKGGEEEILIFGSLTSILIVHNNVWEVIRNGVTEEGYDFGQKMFLSVNGFLQNNEDFQVKWEDIIKGRKESLGIKELNLLRLVSRVWKSKMMDQMENKEGIWKLGKALKIVERGVRGIRYDYKKKGIQVCVLKDEIRWVHL